MNLTETGRKRFTPSVRKTLISHTDYVDSAGRETLKCLSGSSQNCIRTATNCCTFVYFKEKGSWNGGWVGMGVGEELVW